SPFFDVWRGGGRRVQVGTVIADRYVLREPLAGGSTGQVWLAAGARTRGQGGVKLLAGGNETPVRASSLIELRQQGRIDGRAYLVLEYASGGSLRDRLHRHGRLDPRAAMSLIAQTATALHHAHLSGLVHRDVRPEHVLLRADGSVAII